MIEKPVACRLAVVAAQQVGRAHFETDERLEVLL